MADNLQIQCYHNERTEKKVPQVPRVRDEMLNISIAGVSVAVFSILLIMLKKQKHSSDVFLCIWLFLLTLPFLQSIVMTSFGDIYFFKKFFNPILTLLHGPALYIYVILLLNKKGSVKPVIYLHFLPILLVYILFQFSGALFPPAPGAPGHEPVSPVLQDPSILLRIATGITKNFGWINLMYFVFYSGLTAFQLRKHGREIGSFFSRKDISVTLKWVYLFPALFLGFPLLIALNNRFRLVENSQGIIHMLPFALFILALALFGIKQQPLQYRDKNNQDQAGPLMDTREMDRIIRRMELFMKEKQPYLDSSFSVEELARHLDVPRRTLSQVLNTGLSKNFFRYTNEYRVETAKQLLTENPHGKINILKIAFDSGFNSKSSFNGIFKQYCGQTPTEFRKKALSAHKNAV